MNNHKKKPDRVIIVGGHVFNLYRVYDEIEKEYIIDYPDFINDPVYTEDGKPFVLSVQESCPFGRSYDPENPKPYDCNECTFFEPEEPPNDAIGICMNEELRKNNE